MAVLNCFIVLALGSLIHLSMVLSSLLVEPLTCHLSPAHTVQLIVAMDTCFQNNFTLLIPYRTAPLTAQSHKNLSYIIVLNQEGPKVTCQRSRLYLSVPLDF